MGRVSIEMHADLLAEWLTQGSRVAYQITRHGLPAGAALLGVVYQPYHNTLLLTWEHPDLPEQGPGERPPVWTPEATSLRVQEEP